MTSLPPGEGLFHLSVKVGQRSAGRSSVAAAAYRVGARLYDERLGRTFDYSRKQHITNTFVLTPAAAPAWASDRGILWNRAEAAERRKDASLWREIEVSLPRDLPPEAYRPLLEQALAPYVGGAGLVADVAIHCPPAADGQPQPHAHVMLTTRVITPDGFAPRKSDDLVRVLDGEKGRPRGEALRVERARWAALINDHLRAAASDRRVDARSYAERRLDRQAEPHMGERAAQRHRRQRERHARDLTAPLPRPSPRQRHIGVLRALRRTETEILKLECEMVKTAKANYSGKKQDVKRELLRERLPDIDLGPYKDDLYMVDVRHQGRTRVQMRDDSWVEIDHKAERIKTWGRADGSAAQFAEEAADAQGWQRDTVTRLEQSARARGPGRRLDADAVKASADKWREWGYTDVTVGRDGVWIAVGPAVRLHDEGDRLTVHGPTTDDAIRALCDKCEHDWGGRMQIWGDDDFKERTWLEAQRRGIEVTNYSPPQHIREQWEAEQAKTARAGAAVAAVASKADLARAVRAYAAGDTETPPSPELGAAVDALTPDQRAKLARGEPYEIVPQLRALEQRGVALVADKPPPGDRPEVAAEHIVETVALAATTTATLAPRP